MTLRWTRDVPTVAGWYWLRRVGDVAADAECVCLAVWSSRSRRRAPSLCVTLGSWLGVDDDPTPVRDMTRHEWAGPVALPEEP